MKQLWVHPNAKSGLILNEILGELLSRYHIADQHGPVFELELQVEWAQNKGFYKLSLIHMLVFISILHNIEHA